MGIFKVGPCGGDGGEPFSMDNIDNITRVVKIGVYHSTHIQAITICVEVFGVVVCVTWGEQGGDLQEFTLEPGEDIISVKGYYGRNPDDDWNGLRALIFETSSKKTHGPYGNEVGTQFELPVNNGTIIGFHGRAGPRLDALGVYIKDGDTGSSTNPTGKI